MIDHLSYIWESNSNSAKYIWYFKKKYVLKTVIRMSMKPESNSVALIR